MAKQAVFFAATKRLGRFHTSATLTGSCVNAVGEVHQSRPGKGVIRACLRATSCCFRMG